MLVLIWYWWFASHSDYDTLWTTTLNYVNMGFRLVKRQNSFFLKRPTRKNTLIYLHWKSCVADKSFGLCGDMILKISYVRIGYTGITTRLTLTMQIINMSILFVSMKVFHVCLVNYKWLDSLTQILILNGSDDCILSNTVWYNNSIQNTTQSPPSLNSLLQSVFTLYPWCWRLSQQAGSQTGNRRDRVRYQKRFYVGVVVQTTI